jgi:site-specific DNA recombinase
MRQDIATRCNRSVRHVNMTISMAFIAPGLVTAAVEGRLPRGIGIANLRGPQAEWSQQYERLGLAQPRARPPIGRAGEEKTTCCRY